LNELGLLVGLLAFHPNPLFCKIEKSSMDDTNIKKLTANTSEHSIARLRSSSVSIQAAINDPRLSASLSDLSQQSQIQTRNSTGAKALFEKRVKRFHDLKVINSLSIDTFIN
jgi:hypothetical protein